MTAKEMREKELQLMSKAKLLELYRKLYGTAPGTGAAMVQAILAKEFPSG